MKPTDRFRAITGSALDTSSKLLAAVLADYMTTGDERVYPGQELLAARTSLTERSIRTLLAAAVDSGWLVPSGTVGHVKAWRIDWDRLPRTRKKLPPYPNGGGGNPEETSAEPGSGFRSRPEVFSATHSGSDQGSDQEETSAREPNPEVASGGSGFRVDTDSEATMTDTFEPWPPPKGPSGRWAEMAAANPTHDLDSLPSARDLDAERIRNGEIDGLPRSDADDRPSPGEPPDPPSGHADPPGRGLVSAAIPAAQRPSGPTSGGVPADRAVVEPPSPAPRGVIVLAHGQPPRPADPPPPEAEVDPRVAEAYRRHPSAGRILLGEGVVTWSALRRATGPSLYQSGVRGVGIEALIETCALRQRPTDPERPEPPWAVEMAPASPPRPSTGCASCAGTGRVFVDLRAPGRAPTGGDMACTCVDPKAIPAFVARFPAFERYRLGDGPWIYREARP